jgi:hypothetical protein
MSISSKRDDLPAIRHLVRRSAHLPFHCATRRSHNRASIVYTSHSILIVAFAVNGNITVPKGNGGLATALKGSMPEGQRDLPYPYPNRRKAPQRQKNLQRMIATSASHPALLSRPCGAMAITHSLVPEISHKCDPTRDLQLSQGPHSDNRVPPVHPSGKVVCNLRLCCQGTHRVERGLCVPTSAQACRAANG